jgi:hypothetical protein
MRWLLPALAFLIGVTALAGDEPPELLVTRQLAAAYGLEPGDTIELAADGADAPPQRFRIAATYEPTPDPMRFTAPRHELRLHLGDLNELLGDTPDTIDALQLALPDGASSREVQRRIAARLPGIQASPTEGDDAAFVVLERFHFAIALIAVGGGTGRRC